MLYCSKQLAVQVVVVLAVLESVAVALAVLVQAVLEPVAVALAVLVQAVLVGLVVVRAVVRVLVVVVLAVVVLAMRVLVVLVQAVVLAVRAVHVLPVVQPAVVLHLHTYSILFVAPSPCLEPGIADCRFPCLRLHPNPCPLLARPLPSYDCR